MITSAMLQWFRLCGWMCCRSEQRMQGTQKRSSPEVPQPQICGMANCCHQVPVGAVAGGACQLRRGPSQRAHGAVRGGEVQQQLHAALPGACTAARAVRARGQPAHLPASNGAVPAPSLTSRSVIMGTLICNVTAVQASRICASRAFQRQCALQKPQRHASRQEPSVMFSISPP